MFKSVKVTIGAVIAVSMLVLALAVFVVNKLEHDALLKEVVESNTSALGTSLASQLSVFADTGSKNVDKYELLFKAVRDYDYLISVTLYDTNFEEITSVSLKPASEYVSTRAVIPQDVPFGITSSNDGIITSHNLVGTSTYPLGHVTVSYTHLTLPTICSV